MLRMIGRVEKGKEIMAYKLRIKKESILDIISVKSIWRFIKTSAKGTSLKIREEVERLAGAEEAEEIVEATEVEADLEVLIDLMVVSMVDKIGGNLGQMTLVSSLVFGEDLQVQRLHLEDNLRIMIVKKEKMAKEWKGAGTKVDLKNGTTVVVVLTMALVEVLIEMMMALLDAINATKKVTWPVTARMKMYEVKVDVALVAVGTIETRDVEVDITILTKDKVGSVQKVAKIVHGIVEVKGNRIQKKVKINLVGGRDQLSEDLVLDLEADLQAVVAVISSLLILVVLLESVDSIKKMHKIL